ncbi:MAG: hypothetical protein JKY46_00785 [Robiginitomaculum sp.]|nr:hypothetical protein [Robiginitomaculum sp.]
MVRIFLIIILGLAGFSAQAAPVLNSATLPNGRVVPLDDTATIFMTNINTGDMDATNCQVIPSAQIGGPDISRIDVIWTQTDANGAVIGNQNDPFTIAAGGAAQLVLGINRNATARSFDTFFTPIFHVECDGGFGSTGWPAVNGVDIRFSDTVPDIIPIIQTPTADGIANFDDSNRLAVVAVAAVNNTAIINGSGEVEVGIGARFEGFTRPAGQLDFFACETDSTGACVSEMSTCVPERFHQPRFNAMIGATPKTFSFFPILPNGQGAPFLPQAYRFETTFHGDNAVVNASTSVAVDSPAPLHNGARPVGSYGSIFRNANDLLARTMRSGKVVLAEDDAGGILYRNIDRGAFIQIVEQHFTAEGSFTEVGGGNSCSESTLCQSEMVAEMTCTFYDTGAGASSDSAINDCTCTIQPEEGGTCTMPDAPGEQIAGETDLFDALEASQFLVANDFSSRITFVDYGKKRWQTASSDGFTFDTTVLTGDNGQPEFILEDCIINLEIVGGPAQQVTGGLFTIKDCLSGSRIKSLEGTSKIAHLYVTRNADGSCVYQFVMPFDRDNPDAGSFTFFIKTDVPTVNETPLQSMSATKTSNGRLNLAQQTADTYNKPVYWFINGKNVLAAKPTP